jgi:tetratricopeptide (TPR) repeat protein
MTAQPGPRTDFFISRAGADARWAEWIAWQLEAAGYSVIVQDWDFLAGSNFVSNMRRALEQADTTVMLYSVAYFASPYTEDEWTAVFVHADDDRRRVLPILVEPVEIPKLLRPLVYVDLVGLDDHVARERLVSAVKERGRAKPSREPRFPGGLSPRYPVGERRTDRPVQPQVVNLPPVEVARFADRMGEQTELLGYLTDSSVRLVAIVGRAGNGKSALASHVLGSIELPSDGTEVDAPAGIIYLTARGTGLSLERIYADAKRLIDEPAAGQMADYWSRLDVTLPQKVDALVESMKGRRVVILLDGVESSLGEDGVIAEDGLRTFVEVSLRLKKGPRLVLTSRADVAVPPEAFPTLRLVRLRHGLDPADAMLLLRHLDPQGDLGLRDAPEDLLRRAADLAHGIPRALEILAGILRADPAASLDQLLDDERRLGSVVLDALVAEGYRRCKPEDQRVMQVMAAFDRPVGEVAIAYVLGAWFPDINVGSSLRRLTASYFVWATRATREYVLQSVDRAHASAQIPEDPPDDGPVTDSGVQFCQSTVHARVADYYATVRKPPQQWRSIEDVAPQINEFEHRVRAAEIDRAFEVLDLIDRDHLFLWGHYSRLIELRRAVIDAPASPRRRAANFASLGVASQVLGQYDDATGYYAHAVEIAREVYDRALEAQYLGDLGRLYRNLGYIDEATRFSEEALGVALETGDVRAEGIWRDRLGLALGLVGRIDEAYAHHERALAIARQVVDRRSEGAVLSNLGLLLQIMGQVASAERTYAESLEICREIGDRRGEAIALGRMGTVAANIDQFDRAIDLHTASLEIAQALGDRREQSYQLHGLGRARLGLGQTFEAERDLRAARDLEMPETSYLAALGVGLALRRRGDPSASMAFRDAIDRCDERVARSSDLFAARYARAAAMLGSATCTQGWLDGDARSALLGPVLQEYDQALQTCPLPGVVDAAVRDVRHLAAAGVDGMKSVIEHLERGARYGDDRGALGPSEQSDR